MQEPRAVRRPGPSGRPRLGDGHGDERRGERERSRSQPDGVIASVSEHGFPEHRPEREPSPEPERVEAHRLAAPVRRSEVGDDGGGADIEQSLAQTTQEPESDQRPE